MNTILGRGALAPWLVAALAAVGQGCSTPQATETTTQPAPQRDIRALGAQKLKPPTCAVDSECLTGSHCDTIAKTCQWQCLSSSDCGPSATCTADGQCVATKGTSASVERSAHPTTYSTSLFAATAGAACAYTDECAEDAYCNGATHLCTSDCEADADCGAVSHGACIHGRCVAPSVNVPNIDVSPTSVQLLPLDTSTAPTDTAHAQQIRLVATSSSATLPPNTPSVTVTGNGSLLVNCAPSGVGIPATGYAQSCNASTWTVSKTSTGGTRAEQFIWARLGTAPVDPSAEMTLSLASSNGTLTTKQITVLLPTSQRVPVVDGRGEYSGQVILEGTGIPTSNGGPASLDDERVDVTAIRTETGILMLDPTKRIAPSGTIFYPVTSNTGYADLLVSPPQTNAYLTEDKLGTNGAIGQLVVPDSTFARTLSGQTLTGRLSYGDVRKAHFDLQRTGDLSHAACGTGCATGTTCDPHIKVCVPQNFQFAAMTPVGNSISPIRFQHWWDAATQAISAGQGKANIASGGTDVAEAVACYRGAGTIDTAPRLSNAFLHYSGELPCASANAPGEVPLFTYQDSLAKGAGSISSSKMYATCMAELDADAPAAGTATPANVFANDATCVQLGRVAATLQVAKKNDVPLFFDVVRQWISLHSFLATNGRVQWQEANVLASTDDPGSSGDGSVQTLYGLLERLERGWDVVLSPNVLGTLTAAPRAVQSNPDFRQLPPHSLGASTLSPNHEQAIGLPVAMMEAMTEYLSVLDTLLDEEGGDAYDWCQSSTSPVDRDALQNRVGVALRYAMAMEDYALAMRNSLGTTVPTWDRRWASAHAEYVAMRQGVGRKANDLLSCKNPLGLSDESLPLYYANPTPDNHYFATSDYMLGEIPVELNPARDALVKAQAAWDQEQAASFTDVSTEAQFGTQVDLLVQSLAGPIQDACGGGIDARPYFQGTAPQPLDVTTCHMNMSRPDCKGSRDATCYHGTLGEAALEMVAADQDIDVAKGQLQDDIDAYTTQYNYCLSLSTSLQSDESLTDDHNSEMLKLRLVKLAADDVAAVADEVTQCASAAEASFGAACGSAMVGAVAKVVSNGVQNVMENEEATYQAEMAQRHDDEQVAACFNEADLRHVGISTAKLTVTRRATDLQLATLKFTNLQTSIQQQLLQGQASVARQTARKLPSVTHRFWLSDSVTQYASHFTTAKKLTYLALQVVEYNLQQSFALRSSILKARVPADLDAVIALLNQYYKTRTVGGQQPSNKPDYVVLSLRDQILGLTTKYDGSGTAAVYAPYDLNSRLRDRLRDPSAAIYRHDGLYIGQGVYFTLSAPDRMAASLAGTGQLGTDWNVPGSSSTCAERLWSMSATVAGDGVSFMPSVQIQIYKRNTFFSGWCNSKHDTSFQVGKYLPSGYLFGIDPSAPPGNDETNAFLPANITAPINKMREEMEQNEPPAATDLAGRGLFGDYLIIFPRDLLADSTFHIESLEDVLIRFDYDKISYNAL